MKLIYFLEIIFLTIETIKDIKTQTVDLRELLLFLILGFIVRILGVQESVWGIVPGLFVGIIMLLISFLSGEAIGYGDGMVVLVTGVLCGIRLTLLTLLIAFLVMAVFSICLIIRKGFYYREKIPFVPCILVGFLGGLIL